MNLHTEPVRILALVAGVVSAAATLLGVVAVADVVTGQTWALAGALSLGDLAVVIGGGELARSRAYAPSTVDTVMDAEAVLRAAERGEHG